MKNFFYDWNSLKFYKLWDSKMRDLGFQDIADNYWLLLKHYNSFSFVVIINKNDYNKINIKIIDRETRSNISIKNFGESKYKNNEEVIKILNEFYNEFYMKGLIRKEGKNE